MLKKVLSVVLFLTLIISLVPFAAAADEDDAVVPGRVPPTKIAYVAVAPNADSVATDAAVQPFGARLGILIPGTNDDTITITGEIDNVKDGVFDVIIVFDGVLDLENDYIFINNTWYDLTSASNYAVSEDGLYSAITVPFTDIATNGSGKTYVVRARQYGKPSAEDVKLTFKVNYVDAEYKESDLVGVITEEYATAIRILDFALADYIASDVTEPVEEPVEEEPVAGTSVVVTASKLNLRAGPSTSNEIITQLVKDAVITVLDADNAWATVVDDEGEVVGYVFSKYIK